MALTKIPVSILDRANARAGWTEAAALQSTVERAQRAERLGYRRFWVAEHHGVPGITGSAPTVLMAALAAATESIRIGSGGIMLPNHQPLVVSEQLATLEALFGGRIDAGLGRSLGFTSGVRRALGADREDAARFEEDLGSLLDYLSGTSAITARPANRAQTPVFVLATGAGVDIAARAGLAVVFGGPGLFRAPEGGEQPLTRYRRMFRPSRWYAEPHIIVSANIAVGSSAAAARDLLLPEAWALALSRTRGEFTALQPATELDTGQTTDREQRFVEQNLEMAIYGTEGEVHRRLDDLVVSTGANELLVTGGAYDVGAQLESDARIIKILEG
ncbi:MsnO8 family LLM class oxidoreductase [Arthrobacter castelli]|uniref:MsnO8 family LLM class oxidoreductase n=1 Tax=Arthrobacter castelli TaxID=271431 RepID=UPI0003FFABCA|nr:MsnO8 family LLM class oxidoreductase [Arthrobacter castelli]